MIPLLLIIEMVKLQEVVDISVGWYMESGSLPDVRRAIGTYIIGWAPFWKVS
jgi:hypothetical protein